MPELKISQTTWNLKPLLKSDDDPEMEKERKEIEKALKDFVEKWKNRNDYLEKPEVLKEALDEYEKFYRFHGTGGKQKYYFKLRSNQDKNDPKIKAKVNKISYFAVKMFNELQFFYLKAGKIPEEKRKMFLEHPLLKEYRHWLKTLFTKAKYTLSEPEEKIMNLKSNVSYRNWVNMVGGFLSKEEREVLTESGKKEKKNFSEIMGLLDHKNKKLRDSACKAFNDILKRHVEVAEHEINSILQNKKINDELRKYDRPDQARHLDDDIETEVVDSLIESITKKFDISKRFYELKAKLLKVKKLGYHERNLEYGEVEKKYTYQEAVDLTYNVLKNLDPEFGEIFKMFVENGHVDAFPRKNKGSGAFCAYNLLTHPTYILLNFTDKLEDVLILAHETGHGINDELMKEKQNSLNFGTSFSTAEVASTFMEDFVLEELLKEVDDELKLSLMMKKLNDSVSTIIRQTACYNFEFELHNKFREKGYLSKEAIGEIFIKHMKSYMGDFVEYPEDSKNWWVYWSHIRSFFYVYSYASGLLISKALQKEVRKNPEFIKKVKEFLSAGSSDSPKNIFMKMGIDISKKEFWDKGLSEIEELLNETEKLAKKLGKI